MKLTINVTEGDIRRGSQHNCQYCPIALAGTRALEEAGFLGYRITAAPAAVRIRRIPDNLLVDSTRPPSTVDDFIVHFDLGWAVQPFSFEVQFPFGLRDWKSL